MSTKRKSVSKVAFGAMATLEAYTRRAVATDTRHLVRLRASALNGCRYCIAMHTRDARKDGWSEARIAAAEEWPSHEGDFDAAELAILRFTDALTRVAGEESVPDRLWDAIVEHLGADGAGQLVMEVVTINAWNRIAIATRLDPASLKGVEEAKTRATKTANARTHAASTEATNTR